MTINPHISTAIGMFDASGERFHDILSWYLLHGVVIVTLDFLCFGYYCKRSSLETPVHADEADTAYVSFVAGDMKAAIRHVARGIKFLAFERGFKNKKSPKVYNFDRIKQLTIHDHGKN